jgi:cell division protein FtsQ
MKKYFNWSVIRLVLMFALVVFLYSFTGKRNSNRKLKNTEVIIVNNEPLFISNETVNKLLIENKSDIKTIAKVEVDLNKLEKSINKNKMIEKSDVFVTIDGTLRAIVKQKTPVARVVNNSGSFYIDYEGSTMPLSELNSARVPLVLGEITDKNRKKLSEILKMIYDDEFLKKNIIGVQVLPQDELLMKNRNYDFDILFGKPINIERKFSNYKAFFQKEVTDSVVKKYKKINLKFTQQVVCIK